jgi:hypothetical protein
MRNTSPRKPVQTQALDTEYKRPSKTYHDAIKAMHYEIKRAELRTQVTQVESKLKSLDLRREELLRIDGYYRDNDCNMVSEDEFHLLRIADKNGIAVTAFNLAPKTLTYISPEKYVDVVDSIGEQVIPKGHQGREIEYPNLDLRSGDVLRDPKIRYVHPVLRQHEWFEKSDIRL